MGREQKNVDIQGAKREGIDRLLTVAELALVLRVRPGTIYSWLSRGLDIPHIKIGGTVLFRETAVQEWLITKELARKRRNFEA